jgi:hypothetical protein
MKHAQDEASDQTSADNMNPARVWGFEGCGAMWAFYSERNQAMKSAKDNRIHELEIYEAYLLDNTRRDEMDHPPITFDQFLECVNHPAICASDDIECKE